MGRRKAEESFEDMFAVKSENTDITETEDVAEEVAKPENTEDSIALISEGIDSLDKKAAIKKAIIRDIPKEAIIKVRSMTNGELIFKSRSNQSIIIWNDFGETRELTFAQIIDMNNTNTDYLRKPYVVLLNADAVEYFGLSEIYGNLASVWNLQRVFEYPEKEIERTLDVALSVNLRDVLIAQVRKMYENRTLTDVRIIKLLEKKLQIDIFDS